MQSTCNAIAAYGHAKCRWLSNAGFISISIKRSTPIVAIGVLGGIRSQNSLLQYDARIAQALIAFKQVHLLALDQPSAVPLDKAMAGPAAKDTRLAPELADEEIRPHHHGVRASCAEDLDIGDRAHGARRRRLGPGVTGAESVDAVLGASAVIEGYRHLAA